VRKQAQPATGRKDCKPKGGIKTSRSKPRKEKCPFKEKEGRGAIGVETKWWRMGAISEEYEEGKSEKHSFSPHLRGKRRGDILGPMSSQRKEGYRTWETA